MAFFICFGVKKMRAKERLERYKKRLELYYAAEEAILGGAQEYQIGSRNLKRADIAEIRKVISNLEDEITTLEAVVDGKGARKCMRIIPRDV